MQAIKDELDTIRYFLDHQIKEFDTAYNIMDRLERVCRGLLLQLAGQAG